jgi:hypothetical protein
MHSGNHKRNISRNNLIKEMFAKYNQYRTLERVAKDYGITRERVRQYFMKGNESGIINYQTFKGKAIQNLKKKISKDKLIDLYKKYGTVRAITENTDLSVYDVNRLVKIYDLRIMPLRKDFLKKQLIQEYNQIARKFNGDNPSTYDLLFIKDGRNLSARIARAWGTFKRFREEQGIELSPKNKN